MLELIKVSALPQDENSPHIPPTNTCSINSLDQIYTNFKLKQIKPLSSDSQFEPSVLTDEDKCMVLYRKNHDGTLCKVVRRREFRPLTLEELNKIHLESTSSQKKAFKFIEKAKGFQNIPPTSIVKKPSTQSRYSSHIFEKYLTTSKKSPPSPPNPKPRSAVSTPLLNLYRQKYTSSPIATEIEFSSYAKINTGIHWKAKNFKPQSTKDLNEFISSYNTIVNSRGSKPGLAMRNSERFGLKSFSKHDAISDYGNVLPRIKNLEVLKGFS